MKMALCWYIFLLMVRIIMKHFLRFLMALLMGLFIVMVLLVLISVLFPEMQLLRQGKQFLLKLF